MGAISDLSKTLPRTTRPPKVCAVCHLLESMKPVQRRELNSLLADVEVRYSDIADGLRDAGIADLDRSQYARHARGGCGVRANLRPKVGGRK